MKPTLATQSEETDLSSITQKLLNQIPELLNADQKTGALCDFYWLLHMAERGFLEKTEVMILVKIRDQILSICDFQEKIELCGRLLGLTDLTELDDERSVLNRQIGSLHQTSKDKRSEPIVLFDCVPNIANYDQHISAIPYFSENIRHDKKTGSKNEKNIQSMNNLEAKCLYDFVADIYLNEITTNLNTSPEKIIVALTRISTFTRFLQASHSYSEVYTLYHEIVKLISTQKNYYEKTCLPNVDERFMLEGIFRTNEALLGKHNSQYNTKFLWPKNLEALESLRKEKKIVVDNIIQSIDTLRYSENIICDVESLQCDVTKSMKGFFGQLLKQAESFLGPPPCNYCLMALGSVARGDMTPYSDLESVLLIENNSHTDYFERLWKLFEFQICALGESLKEEKHNHGAPRQIRGLRDSVDKNTEYVGLHIDQECNPSRDPDKLIVTPETIIKRLEKHGLIQKGTDGTIDYFGLTLLDSTPICAQGKEEQAKNIWNKYRRLLTSLLRTAKCPLHKTSVLLRIQQAIEQLSSRVEEFGKKNPPNFQTNCSVKTDFLEPITYLLGVLNLYHNLLSSNHIEILEELVAGKTLDSGFSHNMRAAIAELNLWRLHQHLACGKAQDTFPNNITDGQKDRLKQIWSGLIKPLYESNKKLLQSKRPAHPLLEKITRLPQKPCKESIIPVCQYLLYTQSVHEPLRRFYKAYQRIPVIWRPLFINELEQTTNWPIKTELKEITLSALKKIADPDGWQPRIGDEKKRWQSAVYDLFEPISSPAELETANTAQNTMVYIPYGFALKANRFKNSVYRQLYDQSGDLRNKPHKQLGSHLVLPVENGEQKFWIKFTPAQPGIEFLINRLERYLGCNSTPMVQIIKICRGSNPSMAAKIVEHVDGIALKNAIMTQPECIEKIDPASFTTTLLRTLLTNPYNDNGNDYLLVPSSSRTFYTLMRINNEHSYYKVATGKYSLVEMNILDVKSIIYCFNQMQQPLDEDSLNKFLCLDTSAMLKRLLQELKEEHEHYHLLFDSEDVSNHCENNKSEASILTIPISKNIIHELMTRIDSIQQTINLTIKYGHQITGMKLLAGINHVLATYYKNIFELYPTPIEATHTEIILQRFKKISEGRFNMSPGGYRHSTTLLTHVETSSESPKTMLKKQDIIRIHSGKETSPAQALEHLSGLQKLKLDAMKEKLLLQLKNSIALFHELTPRHQITVLNGITEPVKNKMESLELGQQTHLLEAIRGIPFHALDLSVFCDGLTDGLLKGIINSTHDHLITLDLSNCKNITNTSILTIAAECPHLEVLKLVGIDSPEDSFLGTWNKLTVIENAMFPSLASLNVTACGKLTHINIHAAALKKLRAANCSQLQSVKTGSLELSFVDFTGCAILTENGIATLSNLPSRLLAFTTIGCSKIIHAEFRSSYPYFATLLLSQLNKNEKNELEHILSKLPINSENTIDYLNASVKQRCYEEMSNWLITRSKSSKLLQLTLLEFLRLSLENKNCEVRHAAVTSIIPLLKHASVHEQTLFNYLILARQDENGAVRQNAAEISGLFAKVSQNYVVSLLEFLERTFEKLRITKSEPKSKGRSRADCSAPEPHQELLRYLKKEKFEYEDIWIRRGSAAALSFFAQITHKDMPNLINYLHIAIMDECELVRYAAIEATLPLAYKYPEEIPKLWSYLKTALLDESGYVRQGAVEAIGSFVQVRNTYITEASRILEEASCSMDIFARRGAVIGLAKAAKVIVNNRGIPHLDLLQQALNDNDVLVREHATMAIEQYIKMMPKCTKTLLDYLKLSLEDKYTRVRTASAKTLGKCAKISPNNVELLLGYLRALLDDTQYWIRLCATKALYDFAQAAPQKISLLATLLNRRLLDNHKKVRQCAIKMLGHFAKLIPELIATAFLPHLKQALKDNDKDIRRAAIETMPLFAQAAQEFIPEFLSIAKQTLKNKDEEILQSIASSIGPFAQSLSPLQLLFKFNRIVTQTRHRQHALEKQHPRIQIGALHRGTIEKTPSESHLATSKNLDLRGTNEQTIRDSNLASIDFTNVSFVNLSQNDITGTGVYIITQHLLPVKTIRKLDLGRNPIGDSGASAIATLLANNNPLKQLILSENQITNRGAQALATGLAKNEFLELLDLGYNSIDDAGIAFLIETLKEHPSINNLHISGNNITKAGGESLLTLVKQNHHIIDIELNYTKIPTQIQQDIIQVVEANELKQQQSDILSMYGYRRYGTLKPPVEKTTPKRIEPMTSTKEKGLTNLP